MCKQNKIFIIIGEVVLFFLMSLFISASAQMEGPIIFPIYKDDGGDNYNHIYFNSLIENDLENSDYEIKYSSDSSNPYFKEKNYVKRIVLINTKKENDIDSVLYYLKRLENLATLFNKDKTYNETDLILGFLRALNKNYTDDFSDDYKGLNKEELEKIYGGRWDAHSGKYNGSFIDYVKNVELSIVEYFANFLSKDDYNKELFGDFGFNFNSWRLSDPYEASKEIDLIHMFTAMDAIYNETNNTKDLGHNKLQQDMLSWLGDLETFSVGLYDSQVDYDSFENITEDLPFSAIAKKMPLSKVANGLYSFEYEDLLADIDAMNITKCFLDINGKTFYSTISQAFAAYYQFLNKMNNLNRYSLFKKTVTIRMEHWNFNGTLDEKFTDEILTPLLLARDGNYFKENNTYVLFDAVIVPHLLKKDDNIIPMEYRVLAYRIFYNYINYMCV
ncbi:MAG: hypothetical protein K2K48_00835 [Anaeroplasmataceae bacterium]|nr:hypothetical protein [Anaeroplasmataceae bacterium]